MPVLTRSQRAKVSSIQETKMEEKRTEEKKIQEVLSIEDMYTNASLEVWFDEIVYKYKNEIDILKTKKREAKNDKKNMNIYYECYYDQLRLVSELFYIVEQYLPSIYLRNDYYKKLLNVMYNTIQKLYSDINNHSLLMPLNEEDKYLIKKTLEQLESTEKIIVHYLENENKRRFARIDYMGMDTIEAESEYGITDIWEDRTIYEDSNYEPSEVSEQESEVNWTPLDANKYEKQTLKQNTHIRFTDDF
jgi:hypothetical protein